MFQKRFGYERKHQQQPRDRYALEYSEELPVVPADDPRVTLIVDNEVIGVRAHSPPARFARGAVLRVANNLPPLKRLFRNQLTEVDPGMPWRPGRITERSRTSRRIEIAAEQRSGRD